MDSNNWRPAQSDPLQQQQLSSLDIVGGGGGGGGGVDDPNWRAALQPESRQRIVNKIMDTLKMNLPFSGHEGLNELKKIAVRFEEKIYTAASSQSDYLRKISLKMLTMENKNQPQPNGNPPPDQDGHGSVWRDVPSHDPEVQDAANHAVKTIQQRSNSLFPYELLEIVLAKAQVIGDMAKFDMLLKMKRGSKEEKFKVEVHKNTDGNLHLNHMETE